MAAINLEMRPVERDGIPLLNRGEFDVFHDGRFLCRTREPFLAGCRALLAAGHSPGSIVELRRVGQAGYSLRGRLGYAAGRSVEEHAENGTRFVPLRGGAGGSSVRSGGVSATPLAAERPPRSVRVPGAVVRDTRYPRMWRVEYTDGTLSDMVNLTRAVDAAGLDRVPCDVRETGVERSGEGATSPLAAAPETPIPASALDFPKVAVPAEPAGDWTSFHRLWRGDGVLSDWRPSGKPADLPEFPEILRRHA